MRIFGFFIIRWKRLQQIHTRSRELTEENTQLRADLLHKQNEVHDLLSELSFYTAHIHKPEDHHA